MLSWRRLRGCGRNGVRGRENLRRRLSRSAALKSGHMTRREEKFSVGAFPEHEIAEAAIATSADQEIDVERGTGGMRDFAEALGEFALGNFEAGHHPACGAQNRIARRIIDGDAQFEGAAGAVLRSAESMACFKEGGKRSRRPITRSRTPSAAHFAASARKYSSSKPSKAETSLIGPAPIVRRESVKSKRADAESAERRARRGGRIRRRRGGLRNARGRASRPSGRCHREELRREAVSALPVAE